MLAIYSVNASAPSQDDAQSAPAGSSWAQVDARSGILFYRPPLVASDGPLRRARKQNEAVQAGAAAAEAGTGPSQTPAQEEEQQRREVKEAGTTATGRQHAPVVLAAVVGLGFPSAEAAAARPFHESGMVNGIRFGLVGGRQRLVAADQSGWVYILEVPPPCHWEELWAALPCASLGAASALWALRPVTMLKALDALHSEDMVRAVQLKWVDAPVLSTAAVGPFPTPVNMATPSPDGAWIAVVGDSLEIYLVDQGAGFSWRTARLALAGPPPEQDPDVTAGAQRGRVRWHRWLMLVAWCIPCALLGVR